MTIVSSYYIFPKAIEGMILNICNTKKCDWYAKLPILTWYNVYLESKHHTLYFEYILRQANF